MSDPTDAIDASVLADLQEVMGEEVVADLVASYDSDALQLVGQLRAARESGDVNVATRAVHTLKSTSDTIGARALAAVCAELETRGRAGELPDAQGVERVERALEAVRAALAQRR